MRAGDDETRSLMRVLHEDVINRLALLQAPRPTLPRGAAAKGRKRKA